MLELRMACKKLLEIDTVLTADSVEWCPCEDLHQVLASGTYQLDEKAGLRHGTLSLYEWNYTSLMQILQSESKKVSDGILDMKWHTVSDRAMLALANSSGMVTFLQLDRKPDEYSLREVGSCLSAEQDGEIGLCLSLDWNKHLSNPSVVAVSDSQGCVSLVEVSQSGPRLLQRWKAHQFEAWIVCFGSDRHTVLSGGDDCCLYQWDTRAGTAKPTFTSKRHTMGVCSLQIHPETPHLLSSGSYDETLKVWDTRNMLRPLKEVCLGGGVWRIKWCPSHSDLLAAACMHSGFHIVHGHLKTADTMDVVCSYSEHKSLAYGVDWCQLTAKTVPQDTTVDKGQQFMLASSSFYDHSLQIWSACLSY